MCWRLIVTQPRATTVFRGFFAPTQTQSEKKSCRLTRVCVRACFCALLLWPCVFATAGRQHHGRELLNVEHLCYCVFWRVSVVSCACCTSFVVCARSAKCCARACRSLVFFVVVLVVLIPLARSLVSLMFSFLCFSLCLCLVLLFVLVFVLACVTPWYC